MRRFLFAIVLLSVSAAPEARAYTLLGGRTIGVDDYGLNIQAGFPGLDARFHIPILDDFEVVPRLTFFYNGTFLGANLDSTIVGNGIGANLRLRLVKKARFSMALFGELLVYWSYDSPTVAGMRLALPGGLVGDYRFTNEVSLVWSINAPIGVIVAPAEVFTLPIEFGLGTEISLTERVTLSAVFQIGPVIMVPGHGASSVQMSLSGLIGIQTLL